MLFQCPKLTPLQSRFVASFAALILLGIIYWSLSNPHVAYAAELDLDGSGQARGGQDHNWHRIHQRWLDEDDDADEHDVYDESERVRERAATPNAISGNDRPNNLNIEAGNTTLWVYDSNLFMGPHAETGPGLPSEPGMKRELEVQHAELRKRLQSGDTRTIYVSINTCLQPTWNGTGVQTAAPPQLTLFVSTSSSNTNPGPAGDASNQQAVSLQEGWAVAETQASGNWYMSVSAPELPEGFVGSWNYDLAVSIDDYYHSADTIDPFLRLVDTDTNSALLVTPNLTQANVSTPPTYLYETWMALNPPPFTLFVANVNRTSTMGIRNSYCGWSNAVQGEDTQLEMGMITRGIGSKPKEQFYISGLNASSIYTAVLAQDGNSTNSGPGVVGGGGKVWQPVNFTTQTSGNCALLYNLTFCDEVAYSVPNNPTKYNNYSDNIAGLIKLFDDYTRDAYQSFNYSLQQIPCNTTSDAQYSLAKNCTDCAAAYKEWLCAVSIPRCEEFSLNPNRTGRPLYRQPRAMGQLVLSTNSTLPASILNASYTPMSKAPTIPGTNAYDQTYFSSAATRNSRNPLIDNSIQPGPYNEMLPCEDLCYDLVASCPASLGFGCPYRGRGLDVTYARNEPLSGQLSCNYLGAVYPPVRSGGRDMLAPVFKALLIAALVVCILGVA